MEALLDHPVLVLNRLWQPIHMCSARKAIKLLSLGHAHVVQTDGKARYQTHDFSSWAEHSLNEVAEEVVHSIRLVLRIPKIIVLAVYDRFPRKGVKLTRRNIFLRDHYTCQYCAKKLPEKELNLDHVIPRDKKGGTSWENLVTSCIACNSRKGNKLPKQANMLPITKPKPPRWHPLYSQGSKILEDKDWREFVQPDRKKVKLIA